MAVINIEPEELTAFCPWPCCFRNRARPATERRGPMSNSFRCRKASSTLGTFLYLMLFRRPKRKPPDFCLVCIHPFLLVNLKLPAWLIRIIFYDQSASYISLIIARKLFQGCHCFLKGPLCRSCNVSNQIWKGAQRKPEKTPSKWNR